MQSWRERDKLIEREGKKQIGRERGERHRRRDRAKEIEENRQRERER
jgi:hypothetical protein